MKIQSLEQKNLEKTRNEITANRLEMDRLRAKRDRLDAEAKEFLQKIKNVRLK
jgi:cell division protein FtsB